MQPQGGLTRKDALALGPQPDHDEVFVLARWVVHETIDPTADSTDATRLDVLAKQLRRVASLSGLLGGDMNRTGFPGGSKC